MIRQFTEPPGQGVIERRPQTWPRNRVAATHQRRERANTLSAGSACLGFLCDHCERDDLAHGKTPHRTTVLWMNSVRTATPIAIATGVCTAGKASVRTAWLPDGACGCVRLPRMGTVRHAPMCNNNVMSFIRRRLSLGRSGGIRRYRGRAGYRCARCSTRAPHEARKVASGRRCTVLARSNIHRTFTFWQCIGHARSLATAPTIPGATATAAC
jgi:hypothetical protein